MIWFYILLGFIAVIIFVIAFDFVYRFVYLKKFWHSYMWCCQDMNYLVSISGAIRKGKTTLMFGLHHFLTLRIKDDLLRKMKEIETILIDLDFRKIRTSYIEYFERYNSHDKAVAKIINDHLVMFIDELTLTKKLDKLYFDYLKYNSHIKLFKDYLYYYNQSLRLHYVFSNIKVWNQITSSYSLEFNNEWVKLKDSKDFPLAEYSIFLYDEQLLESSNNQAIARLNEDTGSDIFFRLFGQIFRESSFYLTTLQNVKRWFKGEREIVQQHIYVRDSRLILTSPIKIKIINILERFNNFIYRFIKDEDYLNSNNIFKRINFKIFNYKKKLISKGFIRFKTSIYDNEDNVGKFIKEGEETESAYNFNFIIPVCYCWDVGDSHLFHFIFDYLKSRSGINMYDLDISKIDVGIVEEMLKKYKQKNKNTQPTDLDF